MYWIMQTQTKTKPNKAILGVLLIAFFIIVGIWVGLAVKGPAPTHVCEYVDGSLNEYICNYPNPNLTCGPKQYDAAHDTYYWDCRS